MVVKNLSNGRTYFFKNLSGFTTTWKKSEKGLVGTVVDEKSGHTFGKVEFPTKDSK